MALALVAGGAANALLLRSGARPQPLSVPPSPHRASVRLVAAGIDITFEQLPDEPRPDLGWSPAETVHAVLLGLQYNDDPEEDDGMKRLYQFLHPRGRVDIAPPPPKAGLQGFVSLEDFLRDAGSPFLGSALLCSGFKLLGEPTITPGGQARGAFATQIIEVYNNHDQAQDTALLASGAQDEAVRTLEALIAAPDDFLQRVLDAMRSGKPPPRLPLGTHQAKVVIPPSARFIIQMEQERRPPLEGCWLLKEFVPMKRTAFQVLNEGGEEFEGADTG